MAKTRRAYTGGAASTTTSSNILSSGTTSFTITAYTGWPYGSDPFYVVVEPGTANEEKILVTRTGSTDTTINVYATPSADANRGADDTSAVAHSSGATVFPVFTAVDADEANELASSWSTKGDLVSYGSSTFETLGVGSDGQVLVADSGETSGLKWSNSLSGLAVDTDTLYVDATNDRVGINDSSPSYALDVTGDINASGAFRIGGTVIGELTDYSSSITFNGFTLGNGTVVASYARVNDLVAYSGQVVLGSTSSMTGPLDISLPVTATSSPGDQAGVAYCDNPFRYVSACAVFGNVNNMRIFAENYGSTYSTVADISSTVPFTWASTHKFGWNLIYLAA